MNQRTRKPTPSKDSLHARTKTGMKDMSITMRMSTNAGDYEEVPDMFALSPREITQRMVDGYCLYIPSAACKSIVQMGQEDARFHLAYEPTSEANMAYGFLGTWLGINLVTDAFCAPHRRLQANLHPDRIYWTKVAAAKY